MSIFDFRAVFTFRFFLLFLYVSVSRGQSREPGIFFKVKKSWTHHMCLGHPCSFLHLFCFADSDSSPMKICDPIFVSPKMKLICILTYNKFLNNSVSICHLCTTNSQQDRGDVGRKQQKFWK